jgi:hypothetical protein
MIALVACFALTSLAPVAWGRALCQERDRRLRIEGPLERLACCERAALTDDGGAAQAGWNDRCCTDTVLGGEWRALSAHGFERVTVHPPEFLTISTLFVPFAPAQGACSQSCPPLLARPPTSTVVLLI